MNEVSVRKEDNRVVGCVLVLFGGRVELSCDSCGNENCFVGNAKAITHECRGRCQCGRGAEKIG